MFKSMRRGFSKPMDSLIAGLDIGASKVCCAIGRIDTSGNLSIKGIGYHASKGIRAGTIIDMDALQTAVAHAVHAAEEMADETIESVYVSLSPALCLSKTIKVDLPIAGHAVDDADIKKIVQQAAGSLRTTNHTAIHTIPLSYEIDDTTGIREPRGMFGDTLQSRIHMIFANKTPLRNLAACVERSHLDISGFVTSIYASGLSTLVEDEIDLGCTLIDVGSGITAIGAFYNGKLAQVNYLPYGSGHVTSDIARCLSTPLVQAERIKTLYGTALISPSDSREMITVPQIGEESAQKGSQISKAELTQIIRPRVEEIFENIKDLLSKNPAYKLTGRRLVLTGGGSLLPGLADMAGVILDKQTRLGRPFHVKGLTDTVRTPSFSTCAGLLLYGQRQKGPFAMLARKREDEEQSSVTRLGSWIKENLQLFG